MTRPLGLPKWGAVPTPPLKTLKYNTASKGEGGASSPLPKGGGREVEGHKERGNSEGKKVGKGGRDGRRETGAGASEGGRWREHIAVHVQACTAICSLGASDQSQGVDRWNCICGANVDVPMGRLEEMPSDKSL